MVLEYSSTSTRVPGIAIDVLQAQRAGWVSLSAKASVRSPTTPVCGTTSAEPFDGICGRVGKVSDHAARKDWCSCACQSLRCALGLGQGTASYSCTRTVCKSHKWTLAAQDSGRHTSSLLYVSIWSVLGVTLLIRRIPSPSRRAKIHIKKTPAQDSGRHTSSLFVVRVDLECPRSCITHTQDSESFETRENSNKKDACRTRAARPHAPR